MSAAVLSPRPDAPIDGVGTIQTIPSQAHRRQFLAACLGAFLLYCLVAVALFPGIVPHLRTAFPGDLGDPPSQAWIIAWDLHALSTNPAHLFDGNIFYPFHDVLAYQDSLLGLLPFAAPLLLLTGSPVATYNILFLLTFALCALGAYLLARLLTGDARAGLVAGLIYGFSAYRMVHLYHLNLLCGMWISLVLLCWEQIRLGKRRYWPWLGLFYVLQALSSLYYAVFLALALLLLLALHLRRQSGAARRAAVRQLVPPATATGLASAAVLLPFLLPYLRVEHALGSARGLGQAIYFSADLRDFLHSVDLSLLYGWTGQALGVRPGDALQYLWPGAVALGLAAYGLLSGSWRRGRQAPTPSTDAAGATWERRHPAGPTACRQGPASRYPGALLQWNPPATRAAQAQRDYCLLGVVSAILCLGPTLKVWGHLTGLPLPYLLIYGLPGLSGLRDPARFGALYTLCLAVMAACGVACLPRGGSFRRWMVAAGLGCAILAESWLRPLPMAPLPVGAATPPVYRWLAAQPAGSPALELPIGLQNKTIWAQQAEMMYYATVHWQPIVNGTGGFAPPGYDHDAAIYGSFPSPRSLALLRGQGVRFVVVHRDWVGSASANRIRQVVGRRSGVHLAAHWPDADVYRIDT